MKAVLLVLIAAVVLLVATPEDAEAQTYAYAVTDLNLREGPGTGYSSILVIPAGGAVDVLGCDSGWCEVDFDGYIGFVSRRYLEFESYARGPVYAPPVITEWRYSTPRIYRHRRVHRPGFKHRRDLRRARPGIHRDDRRPRAERQVRRDRRDARRDRSRSERRSFRFERKTRTERRAHSERRTRAERGTRERRVRSRDRSRFEHRPSASQRRHWGSQSRSPSSRSMRGRDGRRGGIRSRGGSWRGSSLPTGPGLEPARYAVYAGDTLILRLTG